MTGGLLGKIFTEQANDLLGKELAEQANDLLGKELAEQASDLLAKQASDLLAKSRLACSVAKKFNDLICACRAGQ
jgi:hypothetical protein